MKIQKRRYELTDDEWERFVRYSLFEEQGQRDVPTMIFEQLLMALFGLLVAVRRGVTFLSVMANGIQSTNALQNGRSMEFSKKYSMNSELRPTCKISA